MSCHSLNLSYLCMQVMAYLNFLKKHASPLPSRHSMACSLAFLIMQRKMLTASLLSGPPALPSAFSSDLMESKSHSGTMDLILESLCEALETGTISDLHMDETASESRMVTLASPQYLGNEQVVRRVSLHKVVVDASLKVLSFLALKYGKGSEEKQGFSRLLNIVFPDTQLSVAWLEERNGEKMPLLTEDQALLFARCNTPKLIRAGEIVFQILVSFSFDYPELVSSNSYSQYSRGPLHMPHMFFCTYDFSHILAGHCITCQLWLSAFSLRFNVPRKLIPFVMYAQVWQHCLSDKSWTYVRSWVYHQ